MDCRRMLNVAGGIVAAALLTNAASAQAADRLACFKIVDHAAKGKFKLTLGTEVGPTTCTAKTPAKLGCLPVTTSNVTPTPPGGGPSGTPVEHFLCYQLKCPRPSLTAAVTDQFGSRMVDFRGSQLLCVPAIGTPRGGIPPTVTTTTTLPVGQCTFRDGKCQGTCAGGQKCGAVVGSASCECQATPCGDASAPECSGFCSDASKACVFSFTGCDCVRIP